MGPNPTPDYADESSLLCAEEESSMIFYDDGEVQGEYGEGEGMGLGSESEGVLGILLEREGEGFGEYVRKLRCGEVDVKGREMTVDWILKVQSHYDFEPQCACLSINYFDRFLSAYELPKDKAWMMQLLAVACLSIAAKVEETDVPLPIDLQVGEAKFIFEAKTIQRMELLVLSTLKWRMNAVTPLSFIDHFLYKLNDDALPPRSSVLRSVYIIRSIIKGIDFLEFKPSEIAAAVAVSVTGEGQTVDYEKAVSCLSSYVEKERLIMCLELIHDHTLVNGSLKVPSSSSGSVPQSPIDVLDASCLSYKSEDTPSRSVTNSFHNSPTASKRRRLNVAYEEELWNLWKSQNKHGRNRLPTRMEE
ncbi:Cyclin-D3-1-like protein [Drosera capensis]